MSLRPLIVAATVVLALAAPAQAAEKHPDACHPRRAKTVAHNATLRVFWSGGALYACKKGGTRPVPLGEPTLPCPPESSQSGCDGVAAIRVSRRFVAVAWFEEGPSGGIAWVDVVDVVKRRHVSRWEAPRHEAYWFTAVTDMVLAPSGALGMIYREVEPGEGQGGSITNNVLTLIAGKRTLLDSSEEIRPGSLALAPNGTLYWTHGDTVRSARLQ